MRLIDADALMNTLQELFDKREKEQKFRLTGSSGVFVTWNDAICHFKTAPTIDAVPVKHGAWIDPTTGEFCYRCSVCEEYTHMEMPRLLYHYCPNCGARMEV